MQLLYSATSHIQQLQQRFLCHRQRATQSKPAPTDSDLQQNSHMQPWTATWWYPLRNPCKLYGLLLVYRPQRDGRLSWLTHSGHFAHNVVTCQPKIRESPPAVASFSKSMGGGLNLVPFPSQAPVPYPP